jgi:hypothetical protein
MDYHQCLQIAGGLLALLLFIPLIASIVKEGAEGQSGATWLLWGALDTILTFSLLWTGGNYLLPLGFAIGDIAVVILLVVKGKFSWSKFETVILLMVIACLGAWKLAGPMIAAISSTLAVVIAGIPGLRAMLRNPQRRIGNIWTGYVLANVLSFFGGTAMTVKERFTPGVFAFFALLMFVASRKKKSPEAVAGASAAPSPWILPH